MSFQPLRTTPPRSAMGAELQVNTLTTSTQDDPSVGVESDGDFVVVWESSVSGGTDTASSSIQKTDPGFVPVELQSFTIE